MLYPAQRVIKKHNLLSFELCSTISDSFNKRTIYKCGIENIQKDKEILKQALPYSYTMWHLSLTLVNHVQKDEFI